MALIIRRSGIEGLGCYTTSPIPKGAYVVEYEGERISIAEGNERYRGKDRTYMFGLEDGKHVIDGQGIARYINHCCRPNCETAEEDGRIWIIALRKIAAGEELTYDYMLYDGEGDAPCACGARRCRGTMYSPAESRKQKREARKRASRRKSTKRVRKAA
ncbi:MAG: SET domain-containing protein [Terriglobales bacterium]